MSTPTPLMPRLPNSLGFTCRNANCANKNKPLSRDAIHKDDNHRWHCPLCHAFVESFWLEPEQERSLLDSPVKGAGKNAWLAGAGGAVLGVALGGVPGALILGALGAVGGYAVNDAKEKARAAPRELSAGKIPTFISFAFEDIRMRDLFVGQSRHPDTPWDIVDHSAHEPFSEAWKSHMRKRIARSDVLIQLVGRDTHQAEGAIWEVQAALELGIPAFGIWVSREDRGPVPRCFRPEHVIDWDRESIGHMIRTSASLRLRA